MTVENQTTKMPLSTLRPEAFRPALLAGEPAHQATWDHAVVCLNFVGEAFKSNRNWLQRGWPDKLTPGMLAQLQWPNNPEMENALIFGLLRGCMDGSIPNHKPERLEKIKNELYVRGAIFQNELKPVSERDRPHVYRIGWEAFQGWLAQRNTAPSEHISAWFAAQGMTDSEPLGNSASSATETKEQRQDRRLQACVDAGLPMYTTAALSRLPDGVGKVADSEGVTRQSFSSDVKAALQRRESTKREGAIVHRA